jgi:chromate reductase
MTTTCRSDQNGREPTTPVRVLGLAGSLRTGSYNRKLLEAAAVLAPPSAELELWEGLKALPPFDEDDEHAPDPAVHALREAIAGADAVLIATPQYNASLPGQLKNALDWASRPYETNVLRGKPVAVIGASPSPSGAARAQAEARTVLGAIGADVVDDGLALSGASGQFDARGWLTADSHRDRLRQVIERLTSLIGKRQHGGRRDCLASAA